MFTVGQGLYGRIRFRDGCMPEYDRTYLIVDVKTDTLGLLNVSSIAGKEHKLLFPSNRSLENENPPFLKKSFVKLDSLVYISIAQANGLITLHSGDTLNNVELASIISQLELNNQHRTQGYGSRGKW